MGYFKQLEVEIMEMAHDMGDDFGEDADTILTISRVLDVTPEEVEYVLSGDCDREFYDLSADLDAIHYGEQ